MHRGAPLVSPDRLYSPVLSLIKQGAPFFDPSRGAATVLCACNHQYSRFALFSEGNKRGEVTWVAVAGAGLRHSGDRRVETPRFMSCLMAGAQARQLPVSPARYAPTSTCSYQTSSRSHDSRISLRIHCHNFEYLAGQAAGLGLSLGRGSTDFGWHAHKG